MPALPSRGCPQWPAPEGGRGGIAPLTVAGAAADWPCSVCSAARRSLFARSRGTIAI